MKNTAWARLIRMKKPDQIFDLIIWGAYHAGAIDAQIPVAEAEKAFEHIKKLLAKEK